MTEPELDLIRMRLERSWVYDIERWPDQKGQTVVGPREDVVALLNHINYVHKRMNDLQAALTAKRLRRRS